MEKPSSREVSSLHRWSLMLLPVLWLMPLRSLHTCMYVSTTLSLLSFAWLPHCCSFPELGPMTQTDLSASVWLHINIANEQIESETLHSTGSLEDPLQWYFLEFTCCQLITKTIKSRRLRLSIRLAIQLNEQDIKKLSTVNQFNCSVTRFVAANDWA